MRLKCSMWRNPTTARRLSSSWRKNTRRIWKRPAVPYRIKTHALVQYFFFFSCMFIDQSQGTAFYFEENIKLLFFFIKKNAYVHPHQKEALITFLENCIHCNKRFKLVNKTIIIKYYILTRNCYFGFSTSKFCLIQCATYCFFVRVCAPTFSFYTSGSQFQSIFLPL